MKKTIKKQKKKRIEPLIIILILLTISLVHAMPQISIINQADPLEYGGMQILIVNITSNATITQAIIEFDETNHTLQKEQDRYAYSWVPASKGAFSYTIYATDLGNQTQTYTSSFLVQDTVPPEIMETSPSGLLNYNLIELKAITNENSTCKYDSTDVSYDSMYFDLSGSGLIHTKLRNFGDGTTTLYIKCKDLENNIGATKKINFTIDATSPTIYDISPTGTVSQRQITLRFYTSESASCKWDTTSQPYDNLANQFPITGTTLHEQALNLQQGINTYYISCKDQIGNYNPSITLNLDLNLPPTANINIEKNSSYKALKQGTYEIRLTASEPLIQAPSLSLRYSNRIINIPLEGSSANWNGYLIMPADAGENVGEFQYSGTDTKGMSGTEITSGKLALIDAIAPPIPTIPKLANENNKIKLAWSYEGEETDHYNIYRSTTGNTDKTHFYTTASGSSYFDSGVTNKIGYFYRISAVDKAGNEGLLSEEEFLMTEFQNTTQFKQDAEILTLVNDKINELERIVQGIEVKISAIERITDSNIVWIINEEKIVSQTKDTKTEIQLLIGELKTYRETKITKEELNAKIEVINAKLEEYKKEIIKDVKVRNDVEREQSPDENTLRKAVEEYLKLKTLTAQQKTAYEQKIKELQEEARIAQHITDYEIEYEYKESKKIIVIKESLFLPNELTELTGLLIQELLPKESLMVSEIIFVTQPDDVNSLGVIWKLNNLEAPEVIYKTYSEKELSRLQGIETILLYDFDEFLSSYTTAKNESQGGDQDQITGQTIATGGTSLVKVVLLPIGVIVILALLIYYLVFLKTDHYYEEKMTERLAEENQIFTAEGSIAQEGTESSLNAATAAAPNLSFEDVGVIFGYVEKAYECLEVGALAGAYEYYNNALSYYSQASLNISQRLRVNFEMNTLREKIVGQRKPKDLYT